MPAAALFFLGAYSLLLAINLLLPKQGRPRSLWLAALLTDDLFWWAGAVQWVLAAILIGLGALNRGLGSVGIVCLALSWLLRSLHHRKGLATEAVLASALAEPVAPSTRIGPRPIPRAPSDVTVELDIPYLAAEWATTDLIRGNGDLGRAVIHLHGGSWLRGRRRRQARPLVYHLARSGYTVLSAGYPLSPTATFPEHLVGVKQLIAWVRSSAESLGIDPSFVAITGGSAGAHLSALAALTAYRLDLQPGFEEADTSVSACVPFYGTFDFLNRNDTRDHWPVIPRGVMKTEPDDDPDLYELASPLDQVHAGAPPFLVLHGAEDSLVFPRESRQFADALRAVSASPVLEAEIPGATHGFDTFDVRRARLTAGAVLTFLDRL